MLLNKASGHTAHLQIQKHEYGKLSSTPSSTSKSEMDGQRCFTTSIRATHVDDAGSIDFPLMQSMENKVSIQLLIYLYTLLISIKLHVVQNLDYGCVVFFVICFPLY